MRGDDGSGAAGLDAPVPGLRRIGEVQGVGARSPLLDQQVSVRGIVVGNFSKGLQGVFVQSERADADPRSAEGLFVPYPDDAAPRLRTGDRVQVSGRVTELGEDGATLTALRDAVLTVLGPGSATPQVLRAPPADWEAFEGMLLRIDAPLVVTGNDDVARFGEILTAFDARLFQATELAPPGPEAQRIAADNARRRLLVDDARASKDPRTLWFLPQGLGDASPLRAGSVLVGSTGVLDQRRGQYRLQLTEVLDARHAPRPEAPTVHGDLRIASFNLHNLFNGDGRGGGFPTERGAKTRALYLRQQAKLVAVVQKLQPDIAVLMEVENDGSGADSALAQFTAALNAAGPARDYRLLDTGERLGNDSIRVAMVYRRGKVATAGRFSTLAGGIFANRSRAPLAQVFRLRDGERLRVAAVHFKSKGCGRAPDQAQGPDADQGDGQACWNAARVESARRVHAWLASEGRKRGKQTPTLLIGDFNAHAQEDPMRLLAEAGWSDAFARDPKLPRPYSFVFDGGAGRLDHALVDPDMRSRLRGAEEWHVNADEADFFDYHNEASTGPWGASDHDPILLGFEFQR